MSNITASTSVKNPLNQSISGRTALAVLFVVLSAALIWRFGPAGSSTKSAQIPPRLVVLVVVDQLRADVLFSPESLFEAGGGIRQLLSDGLVFTNAYHDHAVTQTAPGHATISTGEPPSVHGIVANDWYDRSSGRRVNAVYNVTDEPKSNVKTPISRSAGHLLRETIADRLVAATDGSAKAFSVSAKDRTSVLLAGRRGAAFWYRTTNGTFQIEHGSRDESRFPWLETVNQSLKTTIRPQFWERHGDDDKYIGLTDDRNLESPREGLGRTFPHALPDPATDGYWSALRQTPYIDDLVVQFAAALIEKEGLGNDDIPDLLMLGLAGTDLVGHAYGLNSVEARDSLIRLDVTLKELLLRVGESVGVDQVVFILASDHGVETDPVDGAAVGGGVHRIDPDSVLDLLNEELSKRFQTEDDLVSDYAKPYVYLDHERRRALGLAPRQVESAVREILLGIEGIRFVISLNADMERELAELPTGLGELVRNSIYPPRTGDFYVIQSPSTTLGPPRDVSTHGSPYDYDRHVPIVIMGAGLAPATIHKRVSTTQIAPTIGAILGLGDVDEGEALPLNDP